MTKIFITLCLLLALQLQAEQGTTQLQEQLRLFNPEAIKLAANDLQQRDPKNYNPQILQKILSFDKQTLMAGLKKNDLTSIAATRELLNLQQQLLLSDPLINFDEILLVKRKRSQESLKRKAKADAYGLPTNWQGNTSIDGTVWDNEISTLSLKKLKQPLKSIYKPTKNYFVGDVDLHFDGKKMIFSSLDKQGRWQIFEVGRDGKNLRQVSQSPCRDIDNYDPCYLPNGRIIFTSTTGFQGVPCVGGKDHVANLHIMDNNGLNWRRLTFDQEQNWSPTVLPNGQIIYQRWEYTDSAHYFSRVLMIMNPDGTGQRSFYGSNSYWPNTLFYARPIPGSNSKFATIVSGHHGVRRAGELLLFDSSKGTFEAKGAVQKFPGRGKKVIPVIKDNLVGDIWPRFLHPFPLDEARMIVSCQPEKDAAWGIYLVDKYDNICLLREEGD